MHVQFKILNNLEQTKLQECFGLFTKRKVSFAWHCNIKTKETTRMNENIDADENDE